MLILSVDSGEEKVNAVGDNASIQVLAQWLLDYKVALTYAPSYPYFSVIDKVTIYTMNGVEVDVWEEENHAR